LVTPVFVALFCLPIPFPFSDLPCSQGLTRSGNLPRVFTNTWGYHLHKKRYIPFKENQRHRLTFTLYSFENRGHRATFTSYSFESRGHRATFTLYSFESRGHRVTFTSYSFENHGHRVTFTLYSFESRGHRVTFTLYSFENHGHRVTFAFYSFENRGHLATNRGNASNHTLQHAKHREITILGLE
jgi:hypothetical protein